MANELNLINNNGIKYNCVLYADILGFSDSTLDNPENAEQKVRKFNDLAEKFIKNYHESHKIGISDSILIGFMKVDDALSFSKKFFKETFCKDIHIRGAIGIGEFIYKPNTNSINQGNILNISIIGPGLVYSNFADKYHVKGHTLLLICEDNYLNSNRFNKRRAELNIFKYIKIPGKLCYIVRWWEESKQIKKSIDDRTHGLTLDDIKYFEKTKENTHYFISQERLKGFGEW